MHGEVGAATIEAYRRAGAAAYSDQADAERVRSELVLSGRSIWTAPLHQASQLLCAWNAFALQTLGDELVEADYRAEIDAAVAARRLVVAGTIRPTANYFYRCPWSAIYPGVPAGRHRRAVAHADPAVRFRRFRRAYGGRRRRVRPAPGDRPVSRLQPSGLRRPCLGRMRQ
jgi:hypothetical protein